MRYYKCPHFFLVSVRQKAIKLRVGEVTSRVKGPTVPWPSTRETIYIGGISGKILLETSYVCPFFSITTTF